MIEIISRANCYDSIASAYCAWKHLDDAATYNHLQQIPEILDDSTVLSFGVFMPELLELAAKRGCRLTIHDHHEAAMVQAMRWVGAQTETDGKTYSLRPSLSPPPPWKLFESYTVEQIEDWLDANPEFSGFIYYSCNINLKFDMGKSGARLAWEFFHGDDAPPDFIRYVEDGDFFQFKLPESEAVQEALGDLLLLKFRSQRKQQQCFEIAKALYGLSSAGSERMFVGFDPGNPQQLYPLALQQACEAMMNYNLDPQAEAIAEFVFLDSFVTSPSYAADMAERGHPLVKVRKQAVNEMADQVWFGEVLSLRVPIAFAPKHHFWVGRDLNIRYPDAPFSMTYRSGGDGVIKVDLLSHNGFRCNRVAQQLGGGGHKSAADFTLQQVKTLEVGDRFCIVDWEGFLNHGQNLAIDHTVFKVLPDRKILEEGGGAVPNPQNLWGIKMNETIQHQVLQQGLQNFKQAASAYQGDQTDNQIYDLYANAAQELYQRISGEVNAGATVIVKGAGRQQEVRTMGIGYNLDCFQFSSNPNDKSAIETVCMGAIKSMEVSND